MDKQRVIYKDLGTVPYKEAWEYQERLLQEAVILKSEARKENLSYDPFTLTTVHHFLLCEHNPVYTLGKSGSIDNLLLTEQQLSTKHIDFYKANRGGDITYHGPGQVVGYPIFDLEKFYTDIGRYLRNLEEGIIMTLKEYGIIGERSSGETGVWIDSGTPGSARKIAAIGVRCSRWVTMHGFALNVNNDLGYFEDIIPCGIADKQVTSIEKELGESVNMVLLKSRLLKNYEQVFNIRFTDL